MDRRTFLLTASAGVVVVTGESVQALPPATGKVSSYRGVKLDGKQCVVSARDMGTAFLNKTLPLLGKSGVAADLFSVATPGFAKRNNDGTNFPPINGSLVVWSKQLGGTGHVAFPIAVIDAKKRIVRVVDSNWALDEKGQIHDIVLDDKVAGWLIPQ